jgi:RNA polymerase sigma-70 factor (ECF subfamily)
VDYTSFDDQTLIRLIVRADADALGELYDRYSRLVFSLAVATVSDHGTAEEITLDVFTRVWDRDSTDRGDAAKVSTWLTSIARHRAIDELRRRSARPEKNSVDWTEVAPSALPNVDGPEKATQLSMQRKRVRAALAELPAEQREVVILAYFRGYTQREIAGALNHPLGTVKTRIRLAMQKLRRMLEDEPVNIR